MTKITGVKSVDIKIVAEGYGVINWNGPTAVKGNDGKDLNNHSMPKLRGYTNLTGEKSDKGFAYKKTPNEIDFSQTPMYVSANCIRHHIFKEHARDAHFIKKDSQEQLIASAIGLLRGYVIPASGAKRISPLFMTDFIDQLGNGNYEQMGRFGSKTGENSATSIFSKTTFGETKYEAYASINIEELAFISLDNKFDSPALIGIKEGQVDGILERISSYIQSLDPSREFAEPLARFHANYVRQGTIFGAEGEAGIQLSQEAIDVLVNHMIDRIKHLSIKQGKGYLNVINVEIDYNDSPQMMRIKHYPEKVSSTKEQDYAVYFAGV